MVDIAILGEPENKELETNWDIIEWQNKVLRDQSMIKKVPKKYLTPGFLMDCVQENYYFMQFLPPELLTLEFCVFAVQENSGALEYVPDALKDKVKKEAGI